MTPSSNLAAANSTGICGLIDTFNSVFINPLLLLMFAFATLFFVYGVIEFMWGLQQETEHKTSGKLHMLWGLIGLFIMVSAFSLLKLVAYSVGASLTCNM